jgi:hypothetical protein
MEAKIGDNFLSNLGNDRSRDVRGQEGSRRDPGSRLVTGAAVNADGGSAQH